MEGAKLVVEVEAKINNLQSGLNKAGQSVKRFAQETSGFLSSAEEALGRYQKAAFNAKNEKQLIFYNKRIQETEAEIKKLTNIGKVGFNEFGEEIKKSGNALGGLGGGLTKGLGLLRTLAYILPGIGIAGIFNLAFEAIGPLIASMDLFNKTLSDSDRIAKDFRESQIALIQARQKGEENAQKELVSADTLYRATQNQNLALSERIKAVNILQEKYPSYLGNLKDEDILAGKAAGAYLLLKDAIIAKALAQSKEDEIARRAIENDKLKYRQGVINFAIERERANYQKANAEASSGTGLNFAGKRALEAANNIDKLEKEQIRNHATMVRNNQTNLLLSKEIDASIVKSGVDMFDFGKATQKTEKQLEKAAEKAARLKKELEELRHSMLISGLEARQELAQQLFEAGEKLKKQLSQKQGSTAEQQERLIEKAKKTAESMKDSLVGIIPNEIDVMAFDEVLKKINDLKSSIENGLTSSFNTFFNDILQNGTVSFQKLGANILNEFTKILISQQVSKLVSLLTGSVTGVNENGKPKASGILGGLGSILGLTSGGGGAGLAAGGAASGGLLLPILGGLAAGGLIASLFHKKNQSAPVSANPVPSYSGGSGGGTQAVMVQAVIRGRDLVMLLNLEGYFLSRIQQNGRG